ncbi:unnamed protein product [Bursaphelenchus okinawaensis]|uniref:Uncharacterized protein n=1 Tax=Bursaphelenchus okinawaensis TaxID=465554 RepID=A0A811KRP0_9BILA|nr:unnamed protein product [Bursaphelenchus okinawaensis]CAG9108299.1 unnamed protein product [Bursaphelenchus okinawaensis]
MLKFAVGPWAESLYHTDAFRDRNALELKYRRKTNSEDTHRLRQSLRSAKNLSFLKNFTRREDSIRPQKSRYSFIGTPGLAQRRDDVLTTSLQSLGLDELDVTDDEVSKSSRNFKVKKEKKDSEGAKRRSNVYSNSDDEGMIWHQTSGRTDKEVGGFDRG